MTTVRSTSLPRWDVDFLTDTRPRPWSLTSLENRARALVSALRGGREVHGESSRRDWFRAANGLALALLRAGDAESAIELMNASICFANELSIDDPDVMEFGVEAWVNRLELERTVSGNEHRMALRAAYDLLRGRLAPPDYLFGLDLRRLEAAQPAARLRALNVVRNRVQTALLKAHWKQDDRVAAVSFAREVTKDYPGAVQAGALQPIEVLAQLKPDDSFLGHFEPRAPQTEGDFVLLLRRSQHEPGTLKRLGLREFESRLAALEQARPFANPRTPLLWRVVAAQCLQLESATEEATEKALTRCREAGDRAMFPQVAARKGAATSLPSALIDERPPTAHELRGPALGLVASSASITRGHTRLNHKRSRSL